MKEIKLTIDGQEVRLTAEQIKALGIDVDDGCVCDTVDDGCNFYFINDECYVMKMVDKRSIFSNAKYECGNYYRDEAYAKQVAMHQHLNNLLRRYSEQHGGDAKWDGFNRHYYVYFYTKHKTFAVKFNDCYKSYNIYFSSNEIAESAIEEVVKPFIAEHPDFVW